MTATAKQFDPQTQFDQGLTEFEIKLREIMAIAERLQWIKGKIADEFAAVRDAADTFETYTEAEAAAIFKVENDNSTQADYAEKAFASLRRRYHFPHCKLGKSVRYTKQHLAEISEILTIRQKKPAAMKKAA